MTQNALQLTPVTILTGFLGAGKTTLLNRILSGGHGLRIAVLVNDFGSINIDSELVVGVEENLISLANGCICCTIRDDLIESVTKLLEQPKPIDYIIVEASGIADPQNIFLTFVDAKFRDCFRLDSVTCVVDSDQFFANPEYPGLMDLKLRQVGFSDLTILNKVDLAGKEKVDKVRSWISQFLKRVRIVETNYCNAPYEILLGVGRFDPTQLSIKGEHKSYRHVHNSDTTKDFISWSYESNRPFSLDALKQMVKRHLPGTIYRCKGIIYAADTPNHRAVLQVVGRRVDVEVLDEWKDRKPKTQIVAIGAPGSLDSKALKQSFDDCTIDPQ